MDELMEDLLPASGLQEGRLHGRWLIAAATFTATAPVLDAIGVFKDVDSMVWCTDHTEDGLESGHKLIEVRNRGGAKLFHISANFSAVAADLDLGQYGIGRTGEPDGQDGPFGDFPWHNRPLVTLACRRLFFVSNQYCGLRSLGSAVVSWVMPYQGRGCRVSEMIVRVSLISVALGSVVSFSSGCGNQGCNAFTPPPTVVEPPQPPPEVSGCAPLTSDAEEFAQGRKHKCTGSGAPVLRGNVSCNLPNFCFDAGGDIKDIEDCQNAAASCPPSRDQMPRALGPGGQGITLMNLSWGAEPYENAAVVACCAEKDGAGNPSQEEFELSCNANCGKMMCEKTSLFLESLDDLGKARLCCDPPDDPDSGEFDCLGDNPNSGPLLDVCNQVVKEWIEVTKTENWRADCFQRQTNGEPAPLPDVDADFRVSIFDVTAFMRAMSIDAECMFDGVQDLPDPSEACGFVEFSGNAPNGWPEGASCPEVMAHVDKAAGGKVVVKALGEAAAALDGDYSFLDLPDEHISVLDDGTIYYSGPKCEDSGCPMVINDVDLRIDGLAHAFERFGTRRLVVDDTYAYLTRRADGMVTGESGNGGYTFEIPAGEIEFALETTVYVQRQKVDGSWELTDSFEDRVVIVRSANVATGTVEFDGKITLDPVRFVSGDFQMDLSFASKTPANTAPRASLKLFENPCEGTIQADAFESFDDGGFDGLSFEWLIDGEVVATGPTLNWQPPVSGGGLRSLQLNVFDGMFADQAVTTFRDPRDRDGPQLFPGEDIEELTCVPDFATYQIPTPIVVDNCTAPSDVLLLGLLEDVNGQSVPFPVIPISGGVASVELPPGEHLITWRAYDGQGNVGEAEQAVEVRLVNPRPGEFGDLSSGTSICCDPDQTLVLGTSGSDFLERAGPEDWCVLSFGGEDTLSFGSGADSLFAGGGADVVASGKGKDLVYSRGGADFVSVDAEFPIAIPGDTGTGSGAPINTVYAGYGRDVVVGSFRADEIHGSRGADLLNAGGGDDVIYPGRGRDIVAAGSGDDTVLIYDTCELAGFLEIIDCGPGEDTLYAPVGVLTFDWPFLRINYLPINCENIIVTEQLTYRSECHWTNPSGPGDIEIP